MSVTNSYTRKGLVLLLELLLLIRDSDRDDETVNEVANDTCKRLHQHLNSQATKPDNQTLYNYLDSRGHTVKERLGRQEKDLKAVASAEMLGMKAVGNFRIDISHSDGMKQLLVGGGPFTDEINDAAKIAGFALKLTSGSAYEDPEESQSYGVRDAFVFLEHAINALGWTRLEWSGSPPKK